MNRPNVFRILLQVYNILILWRNNFPFDIDACKRQKPVSFTYAVVFIGQPTCETRIKLNNVSETMKTYSAKPADVERKWYVIDAEGLVLGRLASSVAIRLRGKHKPLYTPHIDCGDHIVIVNAEKVAITGNKRADKRFYWHTGYPGGIKDRTWDQILSGKHPERLVEKAIERMLPKTKLGRTVIGKLHVYAGPEHPHEAQQPEAIDFAAQNKKNTRN